MPKITDLVFGRPASIAIVIEGKAGVVWDSATQGKEPAHAIHVTYDPSYITGDYLTEIKDADGTDGKYASIVQFQKLVQAWDVTDTKGAAIPLEVRPLNTVPLDLLAVIVKCCVDDASPKA